MIHARNRLRGFYKLETFRAEKTAAGLQEIPGSRTPRAEFENLITNLGLNKLGESSPNVVIGVCYVGSGSATPVVSDSDMDNFVAKHSVLQSSTTEAQSSVEPWYLTQQKSFRFNQGVAAGNLSEVGMGWANSPSGALFSRALIQDADGNPTSITVLGDEYLDVTYEVRVYPDLSDFTGTVTIGGEDYNYTARAAMANTTGSLGWDFSRGGIHGVYPEAHSGDISDVSGNPSGSAGNGSPSAGTYSHGSLQGSAQFTWRLPSANFGGVRSVSAAVGWTRWQVQFAAVSDGSAIPKDANKILSISLTHSWARG